MPPPFACANRGPAYPEVTQVICRVPSTPFSQAPRYTLPVHLCRFRVRSVRRGYFLEAFTCPRNPISANKLAAPSTPGRPRTINLVPIDYGFRPRLRGRLTLRGLTLRRNPWTCGERVSHPLCATHVSILASDTSSGPHDPPSQAYGTLRYRAPLRRTRSFGTRLEPRYIFGAGWLDQ